jgi:ABC-2 type transport system permease protein
VAAHVLRLRFALLLGSLRGRPVVVVRRVVGSVVLALVVGSVFVALVRLRAASDETAITLTVVLGAILVAGFAFAPLFAGAEDPLDPRRFATVGAEPGPLAWSIVGASIVGVPGIALVVTSIALGIAWTQRGAPILLAVVAAIAGVMTCVIAARCAMAIGALALRDRRSPQLTGVLVVAASVILVPACVFLVSLDWGDGLPVPLVEAAGALAVSPLGAVWAIPLRADGDVVRSIFVALFTLVALALLWRWLVGRALTTTQRPVPVRERRGLGWFAVMPGLPGGAVAARSIIYWFSDPRHLANVVIIPIASLIVMAPLLFVGVPLEVVVLVPAPLMALFFGWVAHNDLAYDGTAVWMHFAAGVRGATDRLGRLAPVVLLAVPILAATITGAIWVNGRWALLPALVGVCAALFAGGLGLGSISSAAAPYPVARPGDGPFQQPQRTGGAMAQALVIVGAIVVSVPALWWGWLTATVSQEYAWTALWGGVGIGLAVLVAGVLVGGAVFDRRASRLMEFVEEH